MSDHLSVSQLRREPQLVAAMFDRIARRYDTMNRLMTAGLDRRWRRLAAEQAALAPGDLVLDVCCGTGDLVLDLAASCAAAGVIGLDLSGDMLSVAQAKVSGARLDGLQSPVQTDGRGGPSRVPSGVSQPIQQRVADLLGGVESEAWSRGRVGLVRGDTLRLPFPSGVFAAVTAAFGLRNVHDVAAAFDEMARVTRPGGRMVCLEITTPPPGAGRRFHALWFDRLVPVLGRSIAGDADAYRYLPASVREFPTAPELADVMCGSGWRAVRFRRFGLGIVALHVAERAPAATQGSAVAAAAQPARAGELGSSAAADGIARTALPRRP